jgi:hypothetical protein
LRLSFYDREITDASVVSVTFTNTGSKTIEERDFRGPLEVSFPSSEQILDFDVVGPYQEGEESRARFLNYKSKAINSTTMTIEPLMLNSGDQIRIAAILSGFKGIVDTYGRISEISKIECRSPEPRSLIARYPGLETVASTYAAFLISLVAMKMRLRGHNHLALAVAGVGVLLMMWLVFRVFHKWAQNQKGGARENVDAQINMSRHARGPHL